jgi:CBS domain-containing protein
MTIDYAALPLKPLTGGLVVQGATTARAGDRLTYDSAALSLMTDFAVVPAATIEPDASVDEANRSMIRRGVRSLLVLDRATCVIGMITAGDILGELPTQVAQERNLPHYEVPVRDVMTSVERMEAIPYEALGNAKVGHVVATLQRAGRRHALVVERRTGGNAVRGIFSLSHIAAALGLSIEASPVAGTFAEVEAALVR